MSPSVATLPHNLLALNVYNLFPIMGCVTPTLKCVLYFPLLRKKMGLQNKYLAYVSVHIWTTETSACFSQYFDVNIMCCGPPKLIRYLCTILDTIWRTMFRSPNECGAVILFSFPPLYTHNSTRVRLREYTCSALCYKQPPETGIRGVGNKKVTSKFAYKYQRRNWESGLSCRRQQVSAKSQST